MKKLIMALIVIIGLAGLVWHYLPNKTEADGFTLAGLSVGDNKEQVIKVLGSEFTEETVDEPGHLSEPYSILDYDSKIKVIVGNNTQKVLHIIATSEQYQTGLEVGVGDSLTAIIDKYKDYPTPQSNQGDDPLTGWFTNDTGQVIIFDSNLADSSTFSPVKEGAKVEQIILTNWEYID